MGDIRKRTFESALRTPVMGCGIQGAECLAVEVAGHLGQWHIRWGLAGQLMDPSFSMNLALRVGKRDFWVPPTEDIAAQTSVANRIDVEGIGGATLTHGERVGAMRTQIRSRLEKVTADDVVVSGVEMESPDGKETILIGGGARMAHIREDYRNWRKQMKIRNPHIAASGTALANLYLALYRPTEGSPANRLLVVEGRMTTHAILMNEWRFIDALEYGMLAQQTHVERELVEQWVKYYQDAYALSAAPVPLVIPRIKGVERFGLEEWFPFETATGIQFERDVKELMTQNLDLATMAFGMALQGGR